MSTSSTSSSSSLPPTPAEFSRLMGDDTMVDILNQTFDDDVATKAILRHLGFLTSSITHLEQELARHVAERQEVFDHLMVDGRTRVRLQPVMITFRRRARRARFHPYTRSPASSHRRSTPHPRTDPSTSSTRTTTRQQTDSPPQSSSTTSSVEALVAYYHNSLPGASIDNPIDLAAAEEEEDWLRRYNERERGEPRFQPVCERCGRIGHEREDCDTPMRTFEHCDVCEWRRVRQRDCPHVDASPVYLRQLRGIHPYG